MNRMELQTLPPSAIDALHALVARFGLPSESTAPLEGLAALLAFEPQAPTAVRDPQRVVEDHIADSLVALDLDVVRNAKRVVDVGSGAGLPGLPLAIALPWTRFTLLESNQRKALFLSEASQRCAPSNVEVVAQRAESWEAGFDRHDLVTVRAVADLDVLAEYAAPLLRVGGALVAWRGLRDPQAEARAEQAADVLGLRVMPPLKVMPYPRARQRHLHVIVKVTETPARFPRRPGVAANRPLGGSASHGVWRER